MLTIKGLQQVQRHASSAGGGEMQAVLLTVNHHSHLWLEVIVCELPESKRLPGCILQHSEGNADGVLWGETCRVDKPGRMARQTARFTFFYH